MPGLYPNEPYKRAMAWVAIAGASAMVIVVIVCAILSVSHKAAARYPPSQPGPPSTTPVGPQPAGPPSTTPVGPQPAGPQPAGPPPSRPPGPPAIIPVPGPEPNPLMKLTWDKGTGGPVDAPQCRSIEELNPALTTPTYNIWLAQYGIQTGTNGVSALQYIAITAAIEDYVAHSPILYNHLLLQVDSPAQTNKPPVIACFPQSMAKLLVEVPANTGGKIIRTGAKLNFASDAGWQILPSNVFEGFATEYPLMSTEPKDWVGKQFTSFPANSACVGAANATQSFDSVFYGWNGGVSSQPPHQPPPDIVSSIAQVNSLGFPFQVANSSYPAYSCNNGQKDVADGFGCPNNIAKAAWWVLLVNRLARQQVAATGAALKTAQQISVIGFETEAQGPGGIVTCDLFSFFYAMIQFGATQEDLYPAGLQFIFCANVGYAGRGSDLFDPKSFPECSQWGQYQMTDCAGTTHTFKDLVTYMAAPEYYWFAGQDMSGAGTFNTTTKIANNAELPFLQASGYLPCYQSGAVKPGRDDNCACRDTIYEKLAHVDHADERLLDMFDGLYSSLVPPVPSDLHTTIPTFSIEHLGPANKWDVFAKCLNSMNFSKDYLTAKDDAGNAVPGFDCAFNANCQPSCGVANVFGNWTELCFKYFLDKFVATYGYTNVMVYDAGFIPEAWLSAPVPMTDDPVASMYVDCDAAKADPAAWPCDENDELWNTDPDPKVNHTILQAKCFCSKSPDTCTSNTTLPLEYSTQHFRA